MGIFRIMKKRTVIAVAVAAMLGGLTDFNAHADTFTFPIQPEYVKTDVPRYIFVDRMELRTIHYFIFDTCTGKVYDQRISSMPEKSAYVLIPGIESDVRDLETGRFSITWMGAMAAASQDAQVVVLDTKTGRVWSAKIEKNMRFHEVPLTEQAE